MPTSNPLEDHMSKPNRFPGNLFRPSGSSVRAVGASAGIAALASSLVLVAMHHAPYAAAAADPGPLASNVVRSATDLNWRQGPSAILSSPGKNSVTLDPCPPGVIAVE